MDIKNRADVERLVQSFYGKAVKDEAIAHFFTHLDLEEHLPRIVDFWESLLFGERVFDGNPMQVHMQLSKTRPMNAAHFAQWLMLWQESVNGMFSGPKATEAIARSESIAAIMRLKVKSD